MPRHSTYAGRGEACIAVRPTVDGKWTPPELWVGSGQIPAEERERASTSTDPKTRSSHEAMARNYEAAAQDLEAGLQVNYSKDAIGRSRKLLSETEPSSRYA